VPPSSTGGRPRPWIAIVGPTAAGKSALGLALAAKEGDVELVSADAMQVYRGMDIGTAKPSREERGRARHHLVDLVDASESFSLGDFLGHARAALADIDARGKRAVLVGGTGLYVHALVDDFDPPGRWPDIRGELEAMPDDEVPAAHARLATLDPVAASRMEPTNRRRVLRALEVTLGSGRPFSSFGPGLRAHPPTPTQLVGVDLPSEILDERIERRVEEMLDRGLVAEVASLLDRPDGLSPTAAQALGYKEIIGHLRGGSSLDEARREIVARTRRFARRQRRWFRQDTRIQWISADEAHQLVRPS
jgi:tRNA dimethylallyltransferase